MFKKFLIPALVLAVSGFGAQASEFANEIPSAEDIGDLAEGFLVTQEGILRSRMQTQDNEKNWQK